MSNFEGKQAPSFNSINQYSDNVSLDDYKGKYLLLYFYPRDLTPGCITEACSFRDYKADFDKLNVQIVGVSCDDVKKHQRFIEKHNLNFDLLADTEQEIVQKYGVWAEKNMYGKKYMGILRESFLIDPQGTILKHYKKVKPKTHFQDVLNDLEEINTQAK